MSIEKDSREQEDTGSSPKNIGIFFGSMFAIPGLLVIIFFTLIPMWKVFRASQWIAVPATILVSDIEVSSGDESDTYSVYVSYRYSYREQEYTSSRYDLYGFSTGDRHAVQSKVNQLGVGQTHTAYIDPDNPAEAVIDRSFSWVSLVTLLGGSIFLGFGIFIIYFVKKGAAWGNIRESTLPESIADDVEPIKTLTPTFGSLRSAFGVLSLATVFWNGMIWGLFRKDMPLIVFIIFALVGLLIAAITVWSLMSRLNPQVILNMPNHRLTLGDSITVNWQIKGKTDKLESLTITFVGKEKVTYRRGTDTYTDMHTFYEQDSGVHASSIGVGRGTFTINIPENTMHTWKSHNNEIIWSIDIHGDIPKWPDIEESYEITVFP